MVFCSNCGTQAPDTRKFCTYCFKPLSKTGAPTPAASKSAPTAVASAPKAAPAKVASPAVKSPTPSPKAAVVKSPAARGGPVGGPSRGPAPGGATPQARGGPSPAAAKASPAPAGPSPATSPAAKQPPFAAGLKSAPAGSTPKVTPKPSTPKAKVSPISTPAPASATSVSPRGASSVSPRAETPKAAEPPKPVEPPKPAEPAPSYQPPAHAEVVKRGSRIVAALDVEGLITIEKKPPAEQPALKAPVHAQSTTPAASKPLAQIPAYSATHSTVEKKRTSQYVSALAIEGLEVKKPAGGKIANMWEQQMADKASAEFQANRTKRKGRVRGGIDFMDKSIRDLIDIIKKLSRSPGKGMATTTYGELFSTTVDSMPALSATLACAKKRGVVDYDGVMLVQGVNDGVVITLIKDEIEDSDDFKSIYGAVPIKPVATAPAANEPTKCTTCGKTVYVNERLAANGKVFHKACFKCLVCQCVLKLAAYAYLDGKFYCENHFHQMVKKNAGYKTDA
eukprot:TRINITY_DN7463_c0_g1_i1.p1 TRINITY_DN7463_c0_g1~~TRINITY_DN7463_c0_g1_i1.p1  ORF type:complete len:508 (-),score=143.02 TRINITY_DN7463_c0_g1_i1:230-1753(-)